MKSILSLFFVSLFFATSVLADDQAFVSNWQFPVAYWFPKYMPLPNGGIDNLTHAQAIADSIGDFDPVEAVFDDVWSSLSQQGVSGEGYLVAKQNGNALSAKSSADFGAAAFKVVYDQYNIYILLQYNDDQITGSEVVELMWTPYLDIPAIASLPSVTAITDWPVVQFAPRCRYAQFGGYKASFTNIGYRDASILDFNASGVGSINNSGTNVLLRNNLGYINKTELGSHTVKAIYTIGYQALTGNAYAASLNARPTFDPKTWRALNDGKGITFDIKIADDDPDDQLNSAVPPVVQPGEYWWNTISNDGWAVNCYSGFVGIRGAASGLKSTTIKPSQFSQITSTQVQLKDNADVDIFNAFGEKVISFKNVNKLDLTGLNKGIYIISANNETLKFLRY